MVSHKGLLQIQNTYFVTVNCWDKALVTIQLFTLFVGEKFDEWPTYKI